MDTRPEPRLVPRGVRREKTAEPVLREPQQLSIDDESTYYDEEEQSFDEWIRNLPPIR